MAGNFCQSNDHRANLNCYFSRNKKVKLIKNQNRQGFTLVEIMVSVGLGMIILGVIITASIALNRSFAAVDRFF